MTRILAFVAAAGLISSAAFLALGSALSGSSRAAAAYLWDGDTACGSKTSGRKQVTLPFAANDSVSIDLPATVHYQPGEKAEAIISGSADLLSHVRVETGRLSLDCEPGWFAERVDIKLSGPAVTKWAIRGSGDLTLSQISQPALELSIRGSGSFTAAGTADTVNLTIAGSGNAEFQELMAKSVRVDIRGSGDARVNAKVEADVLIAGSGTVEVSGNPVLRRSEVRGSGRILHLP